METVLPILVLAVVYTVSYVMKNLSGKESGEDGKSIFGESFPTIEIFAPGEKPEEKPERPTIVVAQGDTSVAKSKSKIVQQRSKIKMEQPCSLFQTQKHVPPASREVAPPVPDKSQAQERLVRFGTKSDAKRAFIYSEIFNRKY